MRSVLEGTWGPRRRSGGKERHLRKSRRARPAHRMGRQAARGMKAKRVSSQSAEYASHVAHPRFGHKPRATGLVVTSTPDGEVCCHWLGRRSCSRHRGCGGRVAPAAGDGRGDALPRCQAHLPLVQATVPFFANEQKYWSEALAFPLEAGCLECSPCPKSEQKLRVRPREVRCPSFWQSLRWRCRFVGVGRARGRAAAAAGRAAARALHPQLGTSERVVRAGSQALPRANSCIT